VEAPEKYELKDDIYNNWQVSSIEVQSIVYPRGVVWDTTYAAHAGDNIDFSNKGVIDFNINGDEHVDTYDTTKYNLLKDTLINVNPGNPGFNYVSLVATGDNTVTLKESKFGIDAGSTFTYNLEK
jgi:hypothetical protein